MRRSEYVRHVSNSIDRMFDHVGDNTPLWRMFGKKGSKVTSGAFVKADFIDFFNSPFLKDFKGLWNGLYDKNGKAVKGPQLEDLVAEAILTFFENQSFTRETTFDEAFAPEDITKYPPDYFLELSEVIVAAIEQVAKPPLFHRRADKILRYDWEKE